MQNHQRIFINDSCDQSSFNWRGSVAILLFVYPFACALIGFSVIYLLGSRLNAISHANGETENRWIQIVKLIGLVLFIFGGHIVAIIHNRLLVANFGAWQIFAIIALELFTVGQIWGGLIYLFNQWVFILFPLAMYLLVTIAVKKLAIVKTINHR